MNIYNILRGDFEIDRRRRVSAESVVWRYDSEGQVPNDKNLLSDE